MQTKIETEHDLHLKEGLLKFGCPECEPYIMEQLRRTRKVRVKGLLQTK